MQLTRITLRLIRMSLVRPFETSFGRTDERRILLVEVEDADGATGWGEVTCGERPFYNEEWVDAAWLVLRDFAAPRTLGRRVASAADIGALTDAVRGHRMARGGLEAACWELEARKAGRPLWRHVGGQRREIPCGVSIGIQDTVEDLLGLVETEVAAGYRRIKVKIRPGYDVQPVGAVRMHFPDVPLMADANSAYSLRDLPTLKALDEAHLMMLEQPLGHDELIDHSVVQDALRTPVCLDECIRTAHHAEQAIRIGACRIVNVKLGRVGGFAEALRVHDACRRAGVPVWCGGMLESGIGRAHNIALSTLPQFTLPGDVSASKRYWHRDVVHPPVEVTAQGTIVAPEGPGLGFTVDVERIEALSERREDLTPARLALAPGGGVTDDDRGHIVRRAAL